jgi:hypothetical protein
MIDSEQFLELVTKIQERSDNARSGYVKAWKNRSIIHTLDGLSDSLKRAGESLPSDRVFNLVEDSYTMEGVDLQTIIDVSDMLWEFFA